MNTDELIIAMGADAEASRAQPEGRRWTLSLVLGAVVSLALLLATLKARADLSRVMGTPTFIFKYVAMLALAIPAAWLAYALSRPGARPGKSWAMLALAPALVVAAVAIELRLTPMSTWLTHAIGTYPGYCVLCVPLMSLAPFVGIFYALSRGAPTRPRLAGLIAGLAAGGIGGAVYATHCVDDSALFLVTWYTIAIGLVGAVGAALGPRLLRW